MANQALSEAEDFAYLTDEPAQEDAFGAHKRIAATLASTIRANPDLKVIGLVGPWGSGKSTVVGFVRDCLTKGTPADTFFFTYDAWLHQSDPPRRAFLEALIHFLREEQVGHDDVWKDKLDRLNGRVEENFVTKTPILTTSGAMVILSLFALPIGWSLVIKHGLEIALRPSAVFPTQFSLGLFLLLLPLLIALGVSFWWRPCRSFWKAEFWKKKNFVLNRSPHEYESVLSTFVHRESTRHKIQTTRELVPTTIEFQEAFRSIMQEATRPNRRFVFVVDNLDRLPGHEALEMWAIIRSFFLGEAGNQVSSPQALMPTVILPIDEAALGSIYSSTGDAVKDDGRTKAFMEKTFDLTFRVTKPVFTNWSAFLEEQMRFIFGQSMQNEWIVRTRIFLDQLFLNDPKTFITPRYIKRVVNAISLTSTQWKEFNIPFVSVSYYCVFQEYINKDIDSELGNPRASIDYYDRDWQRSIAAMHYGVPPDVAYQVLLGAPLRRAIAGFDKTAFQSLADTTGFKEVFSRILEDYKQDETNDDTVVNTINLLAEISPVGEIGYRGDWSSLRRAFGRKEAGAGLAERDCTAALALLAREEEVQQRETLGVILGRIAAALHVQKSDPEKDVLAQHIAEFLRSLDKQYPGLLNQVAEIALPDDAAVFVSVAGLCADRPSIFEKISTHITSASLSEVLVDDLKEPKQEDADRRFRAVLGTGAKDQLGQYFTDAGRFLSSSTGRGIATALLALGVGAKDGFAEAAAQLDSLANSGRLVGFITGPWQLGATTWVARSLVLLALRNPDLVPNLQPTIASRAHDEPDLAKWLDDAYRDFGSAKEVSFAALVDSVAANEGLRDIVSAVLSFRIVHSNSVDVSPEGFLDRVVALTKFLPEGTLREYVFNLASHDQFWDVLAVRRLDNSIVLLLRMLADESRWTAQAERALVSLAGEVSEEGWSQAIGNCGNPISALELLGKLGGKATFFKLYTPMMAAIDRLLASEDSTWIEQWFSLVRWVPTAQRKTLLRNLRDRILSEIKLPQMLSLLSAGGPDLVESGYFQERGDEVARLIVLPCLGLPGGRAYIKCYSRNLAPSVASSAEETRAVLREQLGEMTKAAESEDQAFAGELVSKWGLAIESSDAEEAVRSTDEE